MLKMQKRLPNFKLSSLVIHVFSLDFFVISPNFGGPKLLTFLNKSEKS